MNTKTQELVTAGYALAKGLDAESAKLVKELADALAVQRVRADELNKQVVNLAVENSGLKSWAENRAASDDSFEQEQYPTLKIDWRQRHLRTLQTPSTDAAIASIRASEAKEIYESILDNPAVTDMGSLVDWIESYANNSVYHAAQLRKEAGK
ncbi:hypothetical protein LVQ77_17130 [Buttiauxella sp. S04-F03]|uniref:hypothetical protein n=1 Tax=Buttiauxella sp. W03-F01 TaxID=2904524 RepID=UPI001E58F801|nr:hypothetical protein [Buttiauxella sp. W03-F01]MCE0802009.1 hypothetical protein [Buttiauxella sp. W03-F01]